MEKLEILLYAIIFLQILLFLFLLLIKNKTKTEKLESSLKELVKTENSLLKDTISQQMDDLNDDVFKYFNANQESLQKNLNNFRYEITTQFASFRQQVDARLSDEQKNNREGDELLRNTITKNLNEDRAALNRSLSEFSSNLDKRLAKIEENSLETLKTNRNETERQLNTLRATINETLEVLTKSNYDSLKELNTTLEKKISNLQESNEKRLQEMQNVVDEKLQNTLETRLAQSFALVSQQLESVQQGLGEMKSLAADTKSLKNALINVKERGTYGEVRLEKLLSDILAPGQYETNVEIKAGRRVEFAVKLPGKADLPLYLPIDSKFPIEDYNRILDAEDKQTIDENRKALAQKLRTFAKDISEKYIDPPKTTDFALMFLPTEGLYAEVVQNASLFEELRNKYKVTVVGVTTLSAFLSSLQMGFKTLAIEQRSQEVWDTLRAVKSEFNKFGEILMRAQRQIQTADKTLEEIVGRRTRAINRTLRRVEELPEAEVARYRRDDLLVGLSSADDPEEVEEENETDEP